MRPRGKAPALTVSQFRKIVDSCYDPDPDKVPFSRRHFLIMSVFCFLGMRRFNDIHDLKRKHIQIRRDGEVRVWVSQSKTDSLGQGFFFSLTKASFGSHSVAHLLRWYFNSFPSLSRSHYIFSHYKERGAYSF